MAAMFFQCQSYIWSTTVLRNIDPPTVCTVCTVSPLTSRSNVQVDISCVLCSVTGEPSISEVVEIVSVNSKY